MSSEQLIFYIKSQTWPYMQNNPPTSLTTAAPRRELCLAMKTCQLTPVLLWRQQGLRFLSQNVMGHFSYKLL